MAVVTMRQMLEAGVHFGHQTRRWNPKMKRFIFGERNGIYIIDLEQTLTRVEAAYNFVRDLSAKGGTVMFIGTKKQAQDPVRELRREVRHALRQRALARRHADQLRDHLQARRQDAGVRADEGVRRVRGDAEEGSAPAQPRAGEAAEEPRRHPRHDQASRRRLRARHEEGAHRRHRGEQAEDPGRRRRRHQRRPRRRAVPDPGQRRRHPGQRADVAASSPRPSRRAATSPPSATRRSRRAPKRTRRARRPSSPPPRPRPAARPPPPRPSATPASPPAPPPAARAGDRAEATLDEGNATDAEATVTPGATESEADRRGRGHRSHRDAAHRRPRAENEKRTWHSPPRTSRRCARPPAPG